MKKEYILVVMGFFMVSIVAHIITAESHDKVNPNGTTNGECSEKWSCNNWGICENNIKTRTCTDLNNCGTTNNQPKLSEACKENEVEIENDCWKCDKWSECIEGVNKRTCIQLDNCNSDDIPKTSKICKIDDGKDGKTKNELMREFNAKDGSRIKVEKTVEFEDGTRITEITKKIVRPDGTETEVKTKILTKEENGGLKKVIKVEKGIGQDFEAKTELEIEDQVEGNGSEIKATLSDGRKVMIFILPDKASEIAKEKLKAKNFSLELKEIKHKNVPRVIYNVKTNKNGRFLGIFKLKVRVEGEIDPETGEIISTDKPWWAFLVAGEDSDQTQDSEQ